MLEDENPLYLSPELKKFILEKFKPENITSIDWRGKDGFRHYTAVAKDGFKLLFTVYEPERAAAEECLIPDFYTLNELYSPETGKEYAVEKSVSFWSFRMRRLPSRWKGATTKTLPTTATAAGRSSRKPERRISGRF